MRDISQQTGIIPRWQKCRKCGGWVDTNKYHVTADVNGRSVFLHPDFCADYMPEVIENVQRHHYDVRHLMY